MPGAPDWRAGEWRSGTPPPPGTRTAPAEGRRHRPVGAGVGQDFSGHLCQAERVVEFPEDKQPGVQLAAVPVPTTPAVSAAGGLAMTTKAGMQNPTMSRARTLSLS